MELVEYLVGGTIPHNVQDSVYRLIFLIYIFLCFFSPIILRQYIHYHPYHYPHYRSLALEESLPQSPLLFSERLWGDRYPQNWSINLL